MKRKTGLVMAVAALAIYVAGGVGTFGGLALIVFMKGHELGAWGEGRSLGYLFLCAGLGLSLAGVLLMRLVRNRT